MIREKEDLKDHLLESGKSKRIEKQVPTIEITVFTKKEDCCTPACCGFLPCSHFYEHSSVTIEHLSTGRKYLISFSGAGFVDDQKRISYKSQYFSKFKSATVKAFEKDDRTFENFKESYYSQFPCIATCATAVEFTLDYFPREPAESCSSLFFRQSYKCLFGVFGTLFCMRACPTFPGVTSPPEMEKYSQQIERDQQFFS